MLIRSLESQGIERLRSNQTDELASTTTTTTTTKTYINTNSHKRELKKLNHSILIAYLDLLDILVQAPNTQIEIEQPPNPAALTDSNNPEGATAEPAEPIVILKTLREQKLGDLEILFINMHHLINELRPHQARDNLRCILEMQKQQRIEITQKFKAHLLKIVDLMHNCIQSIQAPSITETMHSTFLAELNTLLNSAKHLTKSLDEINGVTNNNNVNNINNNCNNSSEVTSKNNNNVLWQDFQINFDVDQITFDQSFEQSLR